MPGFRAFWLLVRETFERSFASFVDEIMDKAPVVLNGSEDSFASWKVLANQQIAKATNRT